jgi:DNA polymerase-3 subunit epsilon
MTAKPKFPLKLDRPLAFFDIEATGTNPRADHIIELFVCKIFPDSSRSKHEYLLNPGVAIPSESTEIHGFTDEDVAGCPTFAEKAHEIAGILDGCDLAGYNVSRYDIPLLCEEMARAGLDTDLAERRVVDVQRIYHKREPRDLSAALAFYCGEMHLNAHGAEADVEATIRVFEGQVARYSDLPCNVPELSAYCDFRKPDWVDSTGKLKWKNGEVVLGFGKRQGELLKDLAAEDRGYLDWMLKSNFPRDTHQIVQNALDGKFPGKPGR